MEKLEKAARLFVERKPRIEAEWPGMPLMIQAKLREFIQILARRYEVGPVALCSKIQELGG
jgi:hypothetical protein